MGTYIDTQYRFEGTTEDIELARKAVADIQAEYDDCDGLQYDPELAEDGSLNWAGFGTHDVSVIDRRLANLTRGKSLRVWSYVGCTDGCCEGELSFFEKGSFRVVDGWEADIGLRSAMAAAKLEKRADIDSALVLVDRVAIADGDGWERYDLSHLCAGGVACLLLAKAMDGHPQLLKSTQVRAALQGIVKPMADILKDLRKYKAMEKPDIAQIDKLFAVIEGWEIKSVAGPLKPAKRTAVRV